MQNVIKNMEIWIAKSGMKKKEVARQMEITEKKLSDILHGRKKIDVPIIRTFCVVLAITPNDLFMYKEQ